MHTLKKTLRDLPIRRKLNLIVLVTLGFALAVVCAGLLAYDRTSFRGLLVNNLSILADVAGQSARAAVEFSDRGQAAATLATLAAEPDLELACIYDSSGKVFATYLREGFAQQEIPPVPASEQPVFGARHLQVARPIMSESERIGTIVLRSTLAKAESRRVRYLAIAGAALVAAMAFAMAFSGLLITSIVKSLRTSITVANQVATGDLRGGVAPLGNDEVGQLLAAFATMTGSLSSLIRKVKATCDRIATTTERIAVSSRDLEATASEQAASTHEVVSTAREISSTSQELVSTMEEVGTMATQTAAAADSGQQGLASMEAVMRQLEEATAAIAARLTAINDKAGEITTVVTTITKVADQTNLLSLNAAIEADKAGEYGLGFGVVAREIRRLADQTAVATLDIEKVVSEMRSAVGAGVSGMERFSVDVRRGVEEIRSVAGQFGSIIEQIQALIPRFEAVKEGMAVQSFGAGQISEAMHELGSTATLTAETVRDTNRALEELQDSARALQEEISTFKVE